MLGSPCPLAVPTLAGMLGLTPPFFRHILHSHKNRLLGLSCLFVHLHVSARLPLDRFLWDLISGDFCVKKIEIWLKSDNNVGHFTWMPKCVSYCWHWQKGDIKFISSSKMVLGCYIAEEVWNIMYLNDYKKKLSVVCLWQCFQYLLYCWQWHVVEQYRTHCLICMATLLIFQVLLFHILLTVTCSSRIKKTHCCMSMTKIVMQMCHSVPLYVEYLSFYISDGFFNVLVTRKTIWSY